MSTGSSTLDACRRLFQEHGYPILLEAFPEVVELVAAAHIAGGSDVLGADDELSRRGVWGATFELFLPDEEYSEVGQSVREAMNRSLPREFEGYPTASGDGPSVDVFSVKGYLRERLGISHFPRTQTEWLGISEHALCLFSGGDVFYDPIGELTQVRKQYASYYPSDVWKLHMARAVYACWFYGENNFPSRIAPRRDMVTGALAMGSFVRAAMQLVFLLNREYAPYWKWMHWRFMQLDDFLANDLDPLLAAMTSTDNIEEQANLVRDACLMLREALVTRGVVPESARMEAMGAFDIMRTLSEAELARQPLRVPVDY